MYPKFPDSQPSHDPLLEPNGLVVNYCVASKQHGTFGRMLHFVRIDDMNNFLKQLYIDTTSFQLDPSKVPRHFLVALSAGLQSMEISRLPCLELGDSRVYNASQNSSRMTGG